MLLWLALACSSAGPTSLDAATITYNGEPLPVALERLEAAAPPPELDLAQIETRLKLLEERISRVELEAVDLRNNGRMPADDVSYDPRVTTLAAKNLQEAIDELSKRLATLETNAGQSMGQAGPGLFEIPQTASSGQRPQGGMGGQQGGMGGGQQGGMGGMGGGQQGGMGGMGGGQQGGMGGGQQGGMGGGGGGGGGGQQGGGGGGGQQGGGGGGQQGGGGSQQGGRR